METKTTEEAIRAGKAKAKVREVIKTQMGQQIMCMDKHNDTPYDYRAVTLPGVSFEFESLLVLVAETVSRKANIKIDCYEDSADVYERQGKEPDIPKCCTRHFGLLNSAPLPTEGYSLIWADYCRAPSERVMIEHPFAMAAKARYGTLLYFTFCQRAGVTADRMAINLGVDKESVDEFKDRCGAPGVVAALQAKVSDIARQQGVRALPIASIRYAGATANEGVNGPPMVTLGYQVGELEGLDIPMTELGPGAHR